MPQPAISESRTASTATKNGPLSQEDCFPTDISWLRHLPEDGRSKFLTEFNEAVGAEDWDALNQLYVEWQGIAEIHADPELFAELTNHVGDFIEPARRP